MTARDRHQETRTMDLVAGHSGAVAEDAGLVVVYDPRPATLPAVVPLGRAPLCIGREATDGLMLDDPAVSRLHASIAWDGGAFVVADAGSRNGVIVNGRRVTRARLAHGDIVHIGNSLFKVVTSHASAYAAFRIDRPLGTPSGSPLHGAIGGFSLVGIAREVEAMARTSLAILVRGETGAGKEVVSRAIHEASGRSGPFHAINCAAIPANLLESELFGHQRGAFTGADRERIGAVRKAEKGTLMLDEIGDMPREAQAKLLRVLETREVVPVGSDAAIRVDVRVVSATHQDLRALAESGQFRGDLLARLSGSTIYLPPLRERREDLLPLVRHAWLTAGGTGEPPVTPAFMAALAQYRWPYNVRELRAVVQRAHALAQGQPLTLAHLPEELRAPMAEYGGAGNEVRAPAASQPDLGTAEPREPRRAVAPTADALRALMTKHAGNVASVARELGKDRMQIHRWLRQRGIDPNDFRPGG